jgi:hypothetical protein
MFEKRGEAKPEGINEISERDKGASTYEEVEDIREDLQADRRVEECKANSRDFH